MKLVALCLERDGGWIAAYSDFMADAGPKEPDMDTDLLTRLANAEAGYGVLMWQREYEDAAKSLASTLEDAFLLSASTGAWHCLWLGAAYQFLGDDAAAQEMYLRAHVNQRNIPAYPKDVEYGQAEAVPNQIVTVDQQLKIKASGTITLPKRFDIDLAYLDGTGTFAQTEEALRALGQYLGLQATCPDKEFGLGQTSCGWRRGCQRYVWK